MSLPLALLRRDEAVQHLEVSLPLADAGDLGHSLPEVGLHPLEPFLDAALEVHVQLVGHPAVHHPAKVLRLLVDDLLQVVVGRLVLLEDVLLVRRQLPVHFLDMLRVLLALSLVVLGQLLYPPLEAAVGRGDVLAVPVHLRPEVLQVRPQAGLEAPHLRAEVAQLVLVVWELALEAGHLRVERPVGDVEVPLVPLEGVLEVLVRGGDLHGAALGLLGSQRAHLLSQRVHVAHEGRSLLPDEP
mmetsp:Transcript_30058/g.89302  ORF Transcript_30058/g.89302 Transcript_30058/m.89302 type:complete len:242 (-) Transcript_30058:193-918(-)